jgi:hypothetical protein
MDLHALLRPVTSIIFPPIRLVLLSICRWLLPPILPALLLFLPLLRTSDRWSSLSKLANELSDGELLDLGLQLGHIGGDGDGVKLSLLFSIGHLLTNLEWFYSSIGVSNRTLFLFFSSYRLSPVSQTYILY